MDKRYQVFISSTYEDLKHERDAVIKAVLEMGHFPVGMEMFNAADEEQWVTIQREIDRSDYYLLIVAHRYGSTIAAEGGISYTEKEFDYAVSTGVPRIGFVIDKGVSWETTFVDQGRQKKRLDQFKTKVKGRPVDFWKSRDDLATKVVLSLGKLIANTTRPGWQRGGGTTEEVAGALARLAEENTRLRDENARLRLLALPEPQLKFYFADQNGNSLGDTLIVDVADIRAREHRIAQSVTKIRNLIIQYDSIHEGDLHEPLKPTHVAPIKIEKLVVQQVVDQLNEYGIYDVPRFIFTGLFTDASPHIFNINPKPIGGADYPKYKIFEEIRQELINIKPAADEYSRQKNSFNYRIDCQNFGRVAAEHVQVRIRAQSRLLTLAGAQSNNDFDTSELDASNHLVMLIPHDQMEVAGGNLNKSAASGEVVIHIQALAKNLSEPQEHQLKIVFDSSRPPTLVS
ncbi:DUF4062 domain-containing protein [Deinococcus soli (ex Cha et al. 2016)]|uniref:DUF4062 domain-containing protein n=1 Tax=Deinococcus soli (ex Cha et al. 2016) TaxID=1309411 RepID=UPI00166B7E34|nr:DUF4062 domain-containing protein [Deinococcus soli (ex Cha et al. 2016)]GGB69203.1 hypothetical protein GCM10008019_26740 [Deinococcus soli (ex Cha et al. 2016)]